MVNHTIAIIGAGHLGSALARGLIKAGYPASSIVCSNRNTQKLQGLKNSHNLVITSSNIEAIKDATIVVLAVKPQALKEVCKEIGPGIKGKGQSPLIISLASVVHTDSIATSLGAENISIIRVMTNTPIEFNKGSSALFANASVNLTQKQQVESLFKKVGEVFWVEEEQMLNTLTAPIGCSPAYVFLFLEALERAAISRGIAPEEATRIALQAMKGSVELAEHSGKTFSQLRDNVTTPSGVTDYSLKKFSKEDLFKAFGEVYKAAEERINELDKAEAVRI